MTTVILSAALLAPAPLERWQVAQHIRDAAKAERYAISPECVTAMADLCFRESRYNPAAQNKRSTAYGLYQFLNRTWDGVGIRKTSDPYLQTLAALRYLLRRYKTPSRGNAFQRRRGWY